MTVSILDAMANSGASEFTTATISAGATGYYLVWKGTTGSEAVGRTSVSVGGQNLTLLSEGQNTHRNVAIQLWFLDSAGIDARTDDNISYAGGVHGSRTTVQWSTVDGDQAGGTAVGFVPEGNSTSIALSLARADNSITFAVGGAEDTVSNVTLTNPAQSVQYNGAGANAYGSQADSSGVSDVTMSFGVSRDLGLVAVNVGSAAAAGPTITGPDTTTEGSATVQAGTLLDTVVTQSLISGSYSIQQTIDSATATTLNYVAESGVNQCTPSTPVSGVPLEPTITAVGITPYVVQQEADDGVNPKATRDITLNGEATYVVVQAMIASANTTGGESVLAISIVDVEDNHQFYAPKEVDGVTFTWANDGTFTTNKNQTVTFDLRYYAPSTGEWSCVSLTVRGTSIVSSTLISINIGLGITI